MFREGSVRDSWMGVGFDNLLALQANLHYTTLCCAGVGEGFEPPIVPPWPLNSVLELLLVNLYIWWQPLNKVQVWVSSFHTHSMTRHFLFSLYFFNQTEHCKEVFI